MLLHTIDILLSTSSLCIIIVGGGWGVSISSAAFILHFATDQFRLKPFVSVCLLAFSRVLL
jgi:hypothetical protein